MCSSNAIGAVISPIGAVAPKTGAGQALDPVSVAGRKTGGTTGMAVDPAGALRGNYQPTPVDYSHYYDNQTSQTRDKQLVSASSVQQAQIIDLKTKKSLDPNMDGPTAAPLNGPSDIISSKPTLLGG